MDTKTFQLLVDGAPYDVRATPFTYNTETRFAVSYNGSEEYIFAWDAEMSLYAAIDTGSLEIPASLEEAISQELLKTLRKSQV